MLNVLAPYTENLEPEIDDGAPRMLCADSRH